MLRRLMVVCLACAVACVVGCSGSPARDVWYEGLVQCADNQELDRRSLLYLGESNVHGPGSIWRKESGVYKPRSGFRAAIPDNEARDRYIIYGATASCDTNKYIEWDIRPEMVLSSIAPILKSRIGFDVLNKGSKDVAVVVSAWRHDHIDEIKYEAWILSGDSGVYGRDLQQQDGKPRWVMTSAVAVKGFQARMNLSSAEERELDSSLPINEALSIKSGVEVRRVSNSEILITSTDEFYVVGTLSRVRADVTLGHSEHYVNIEIASRPDEIAARAAVGE